MKSRRDFLIKTPLALLGATLASYTQPLTSAAETLSRSPRRKAPAGFAELHFLTHDPQFSDYRPAIDAATQYVVFERTPHDGITSLSILSLADGTIRPFIQTGQSDDLFTGPSQTRPDWSWVTGKVVLDVAETNDSVVRVLIADANGTPLQNVPNSEHYFYPTWSPEGTQLIVFNSSPEAMPRPCTSVIDLDGTVVAPNLNGRDTYGTLVFGGFAAPWPYGDGNLIAYAGQPDGPWGPTAASGYNENYNYVFTNIQDGPGEFTSVPLESDASTRVYDPTHQGRAPVWSPDGGYIAFESNRAGGYAIFLVNIAEASTPVQVTEASYEAQHAKFYPDGKKLVLTALQEPGTRGPRGIAWVDITPYL